MFYFKTYVVLSIFDMNPIDRAPLRVTAAAVNGKHDISIVTIDPVAKDSLNKMHTIAHENEYDGNWMRLKFSQIVILIFVFYFIAL